MLEAGTQTTLSRESRQMRLRHGTQSEIRDCVGARTVSSKEEAQDKPMIQYGTERLGSFKTRASMGDS